MGLEEFRLRPKEVASALIDELTVVAINQKVSYYRNLSIYEPYAHLELPVPNSLVVPLLLIAR